MLSVEIINYLNRVEREGTNKRRFDELSFANTWGTRHYNDTSSIFIYDHDGKRVLIIKDRGQFVNYTIL